MDLKRHVTEEWRKMQLSSRITLIYGFMLAVIMVITSMVTLAGLNYVLYHHAEVEVEISVKKAMAKLEEKAAIDNSFGDEEGHGAEHGHHGRGNGNGRRNNESGDPSALLPGVVLRVFDNDGQMVYESDDNYFKMELLDSNISEHPSMWANTDVFKVIEFRNMIIYRRDIPISFKGKNYNMVFLKTVTGEKNTIENIKQVLLAADLAGILIALLLGFIIIRKMLEPVRTLNETAKTIEVDDLSRRIEVSPAGDELTELATTFNTMLDRLESGFKAQQKFVSDASHELRTPLTVIHGYADMLDRWGSSDPEVLKESVEAIKSQSEEMQELVENLLFMARADQNRQILKKVPLDMGDVIQDVAKKMKVALADKHELQVLRSDAGCVFADEVTIKQMLRIFLENSGKYTPTGGHITIAGRLDVEYNRYVVELTDDGIGIAPDDQKKIFQRFYRVDSSRTKAAGAPGGTGLGLSIAQWIAESHDMKIDVESELGRGTKFILSIPLFRE